MDEEHLEHIVRRRMANTGESYAVARAEIRAAAMSMDMTGPKGWVEAWLAEPGPEEVSEDRHRLAAITAWLGTRPVKVQALIILFPPLCVVAAAPGVVMLVPPPDGHAVVIGYCEDDRPASIIVKAWPDAGVHTYCAPADLTLFGCHGGMTIDWVMTALGLR